jgi:predicted component of type VI protein secretion system
VGIFFCPSLIVFSGESKKGVRSLAGEQFLKTKYRAVRNQIFDFLGVTGCDGILPLLYESHLRRQVSDRTRQLARFRRQIREF